MKPIAILNNGPIRHAKAEFYEACGGDQATLFGRASGLPETAFADFDIENGDGLPDPKNFSAVILTGSPAMITDYHPWAEAEADWVRRHRGRLPMLGVCFGHQILTHALGGKIIWTPSGPEYGTVKITLEAAATDDPLLAGLASGFVAQAAHCQNAAALPPDATLLATGVSGVQAARFDDMTWGLQFHPEFTPKAMRGLFDAYRDRYDGMGLDVDTLAAGLAEAPEAMGIVRRFVEIAGLERLANAAE